MRYSETSPCPVDDVAGDHHEVRLGQERAVGDRPLFGSIGTAIAEDHKPVRLIGGFRRVRLGLEDDFSVAAHAVSEDLARLQTGQSRVIDAVRLDSRNRHAGERRGRARLPAASGPRPVVDGPGGALSRSCARRARSAAWLERGPVAGKA